MKDECPNCGFELTFDEVDIGVGVLKGNPGCENCHWTPQKDLTNTMTEQYKHLLIGDLRRLEADAHNLIHLVNSAVQELQADGKAIRYELTEVEKSITKINEILARVEKSFEAYNG
jgi:formate-dependent nitrite reductase cytochrome c552 subunit